MNLSLIITISALLALLLAQNTTEGTATEEKNPDQSSKTLLLDVPYTFSLKPKTPVFWEVVVPQDYNQEGDLYITIQSPPNDPLQQPSTSVIAQGNTVAECSADNSEFSSVCRVNADALAAGLKVTVRSECVVNCELRVVAVIESQLTIYLDSKLGAASPQDSPGEFEFKILVPESLDFTDLAFYAQINDFNKAGEGLELYANIGAENTSVPSDQNFQVSGEPIYWGGEGLFFDRKDFEQGRWIKIYLSMAAGMKATLYWHYSVGHSFEVALGTAYFDYTTKEDAKAYNLNLGNASLSGSTVYLYFVVYSGLPTVRVSMNANFSSILAGTGAYGSNTFMITEEMRNNLGFDGKIYILVSSPFNADFYFSSWLSSGEEVEVTLNNAYYSELQQNKVQNYFYTDLVDVDSQDPLPTKISYALKVEIVKGSGTFGVRRCRAAEEGKGSSSCLFGSTKDFGDNSKMVGFDEIPVTMKSSSNFYQILFSYDVSQCKSYQGSNSTVTTFYCVFHLIGANQNSQDLQYTLALQKRDYHGRLREGQLVKEVAFEKETLFYRFGLSSLEGVKQVLFYSTTIEGSIFMLGSTTDPFPSFDSSNLKSSSSGRIAFSGDNMSRQFFIAVQAQEFSQYTIGVVVTREASPSPDTSKNDTKGTNDTRLPDTTSSKVSLQLGATQQFTLQQEESVWFTIKSFEDSNVTVEVIELVGTVQMEVSSEDGRKADCLSKQSSDTLTCDLSLQKSRVVNIRIIGKGRRQRFAISYFETESCQTYSLNLPLYKQLPPGQDDCVTFSVSKLADLTLTTSVPLSFLLNSHFSLQVCLNGKCLEGPTLHHRAISQEVLGTYCQLLGPQKKSCPIRLNFINNSTQTLYFDLVLQEASLDVALFDGISEKITAEDLSTSKAKQLYFEVDSPSSLRVFFTSLTSETYVILGHFVEEEQFLANKSKSIYLDYGQNSAQNASNSNYYSFVKYGAGSGLFVVSSSDIQKYCKACVFTLAVYPVFRSNSRGFSAFEVEVSQQETALAVGQSKIGYLQEDDIFVYRLDQPVASDALLSIRDRNKESSKQKNCFRISRGPSSQPLDEQVLVIAKGSTDLSLFVTAASLVCSFEVTYASTETPIVSVIQNDLNSFETAAKGKNYFLYDHKTDAGFKVVLILSSGAARISITPVSKGGSALDKLLKEDPSQFPLAFDDNQGEAYVSKDFSGFCADCSYLIAVSTNLGAKGQLSVLGNDSPVPLSINGIVRENILVKEGPTKRSYSFSSIVDFNISISMIFGSLKVTVTDPENKDILSNKTVKSSTTLQISHSKSLEQYSYEYDSALTRFRILVEAEVNSSFTIKASKVSISERLFEGISSSATLKKGEPYTFEFLNLNEPQGTNTTLNILLEVVSITDPSKSFPNVELVAEVSSSSSQAPSPLTILRRRDSDSAINVELPLVRGDYYIGVTSDLQVEASVVLVKEALVHLRPQQYLLMSSPHTFELYSPGKAVLLEIFTCSGELEIKASEFYKDLGSEKDNWGEVVLEESNYGGHFVVSSSAVYGEYFVRVGSRGVGPQLEYMLYYYYYDREDQQPYRMVGLRSPEVTYTLAQDSVVFSVQPVFTKIGADSNVKEMEIRYVFYLSKEKETVRRYANCRLSGQMLYRSPTAISEGAVSLSLSSEEMKVFSEVYFVGAEAVVSVVLKDEGDRKHYPSELNLIYSITEMSSPLLPASSPTEDNYSVRTVVLFMLFPFALAGLALYCAIRFCIKKYRGMVPDFVEEEAGESEEVVQYK